MRIVWSLKISGYRDISKDEDVAEIESIRYSDLEDVDLEEISRLIKEGFTSGLLDKEEESDV